MFTNYVIQFLLKITSQPRVGFFHTHDPIEITISICKRFFLLIPDLTSIRCRTPSSARLLGDSMESEPRYGRLMRLMPMYSPSSKIQSSRKLLLKKLKLFLKKLNSTVNGILSCRKTGTGKGNSIVNQAIFKSSIPSLFSFIFYSVNSEYNR